MHMNVIRNQVQMGRMILASHIEMLYSYIQRVKGTRGLMPSVSHEFSRMREAVQSAAAYIALTISSVILLASPNSIIVLSR